MKNKLHTFEWLQGVELFEADYDDQVFGRHAHSGFAIGTITNGVGGYRCQGSDHVLPPFTLSLMNPEEAHTGYAVEGRLQYKMFYVSEEVVQQLLGMRDIPGFRDVTPSDPGHVVADAFRRISDRVNKPDGTGSLGIEEAVHNLLGSAFTRHGRGKVLKAGRENTSVARVMEIIDAHVETAATSDLSISDIANEVSLNPNYLIQCFTKSRGISPRQYMIFKKICRSKSMIASGASLIETALALGFYDQAHFIRHFRKMVGVTPGRMIIHCKKKTPIPA
jgi:AraC-like DNA-binding protein